MLYVRAVGMSVEAEPPQPRPRLRLVLIIPVIRRIVRPQPGIFSHAIFKQLRHVVVELLVVRRSMHHHYRIRDAVSEAARSGIVVFNESEVRHRIRVVILQSHCVQPDEMHETRIQTEVRIPVYPLKCMLARSQTVMVANQADKGAGLRFQNVASPQKLLRQSEITLVATVHDEHHILSAVKKPYCVPHLVVCRLRVGDECEAYSVFAVAHSLYASYRLAMNILTAVESGRVRVILEISARRHHSQTATKSYVSQSHNISVDRSTKKNQRLPFSQNRDVMSSHSPSLVFR